MNIHAKTLNTRGQIPIPDKKNTPWPSGVYARLYKIGSVIESILLQRPCDYLHELEKGFDKIQHSFQVKTLEKIGVGGFLLNVIKCMYSS